MKAIRGALLSLALTVCWGTTAGLADVTIKLKNGTTIVVPIDSEQVESVTVGDGELKESKPQPKKTAEDGRKPRKRSEAYRQAPLPTENATTATETFGLPGASTFIEGVFGGGEGLGRTITVGPMGQYKLPSAAARQAGNGDIIEIEPGLYVDDYATWEASNLTIRSSDPKRRVHLRSTKNSPNGKAIWVISGKNITIDGIEFSGARSSSRNGAGIRHEGGKLTVRNSYFHHNESGILVANIADTELVVEDSEFSYRRYQNPRAHAIYMGSGKSLVVRNSYFHHNDRGHHIKSRAAATTIINNRILDGDGGSSYLVDMSNCGESLLIGNVFQQGEYAENTNMISYGAEGCDETVEKLVLVHNTFVNDRGRGTFLLNRSNEKAVLANNLMVGRGNAWDGLVDDRGNLKLNEHAFVDKAKWDYHLVAGSAAVNAGEAKALEGLPVPEGRTFSGRPDMGAYELVQ